MNLKWKAQKGIWNPVSNDLPLEDSGDQDDPKWLGSPEGGRRVSELVGVPKGKIKSPERGQWSDGRGSIPRREKPPPRIPNPLGIPHPSYQPHPPNRWTLAGKANLSRKEVRKNGTTNNSLRTKLPYNIKISPQHSMILSATRILAPFQRVWTQPFL